MKETELKQLKRLGLSAAEIKKRKVKAKAARTKRATAKARKV